MANYSQMPDNEVEMGDVNPVGPSIQVGNPVAVHYPMHAVPVAVPHAVPVAQGQQQMVFHAIPVPSGNVAPVASAPAAAPMNAVATPAPSRGRSARRAAILNFHDVQRERHVGRKFECCRYFKEGLQLYKNNCCVLTGGLLMISIVCLSLIFLFAFIGAMTFGLGEGISWDYGGDVTLPSTIESDLGEGECPEFSVPLTEDECMEFAKTFDYDVERFYTAEPSDPHGCSVAETVYDFSKPQIWYNPYAGQAKAGRKVICAVVETIPDGGGETIPDEKGCADEERWMDTLEGVPPYLGCAEMAEQNLCFGYQKYSEEAQRACKLSCGLCDAQDMQPKPPAPALSPLHLHQEHTGKGKGTHSGTGKGTGSKGKGKGTHSGTGKGTGSKDGHQHHHDHDEQQMKAGKGMSGRQQSGYEYDDETEDDDYFNGYNMLRMKAMFIGAVFIFVTIAGPLKASYMIAIFEAMRDDGVVKCKNFFAGYSCPYWCRLLVLMVVMGVMVQLGFMCFIIPGVWFTFAFQFALPLHREKSFLGVCGSLIVSIKITHKYFCSMIGFCLLLGLINFVGFLLFGIGLLFTVPWTACTFLYCFNHLVGVNGVADAPAWESHYPPVAVEVAGEEDEDIPVAYPVNDSIQIHT